MIIVRIVPPDVRMDDPGCAVTVQLRDTSLADVAHPVVAEARSTFPSAGNVPFDVTLEPDESLPPGRYSLWVHCAHGSEAGIGAGDLITTESFPVDPADGGVVEVRLTRV
jgi:hypothetical protein